MNPAPPISFTERFRLVARERALLPNSIASYTFWIKLFYRFTCRGAATWTGRDWEGFERSLLAADPPYSYAARRQARCALAFAFSRVLGKDVGRLDLPIIPKPERKLPVVPTRAELGLVFAQLRGVDRLQALLMYGSGPRVEEVCRLRVQDVDFTRATLRIWDGKGAKNRLTVLPVGLIQRLLGHANVETTLLYLHIDEAEAFSPLDVPTAALVPAWSIERREVLALAAAA